MAKKISGEKTNLYLLSIVAIVAVVGVVVLVLNSGAGSSDSVGQATTFEVDGNEFTVESSGDLTGQVAGIRVGKCGTVRDMASGETRNCRWSGGVCVC